MVGQENDVTETTIVCNEFTKMAHTQNKNPFELVLQRNHNLSIWEMN